MNVIKSLSQHFKVEIARKKCDLPTLLTVTEDVLDRRIFVPAVQQFCSDPDPYIKENVK